MKKNILSRGLYSIALIGCVTFLSINSTSAQKTAKLTDPEIASVAVTANQIDVNYGKIALKQAQSSEVKHFAESMIKDHESIIKSAVALAGKLGVTPKNNAVTESLLKGEKETVAKLKQLKGNAFDKAYISNEVSYHEAVISAVKTTLIPQTQNEELKQMLIKVTPLLEQHLEMAKMAEAKIK